MGSKIYSRDWASTDGVITNIASGDLGDANTSYTYIDLTRDGYKYLTLEHIITATTLTIETCNVGLEEPAGTFRPGTATTTDGTGATIVDSTLTATYASDDDLNQGYLRIVQDDTTPANVGLVREIVDYTAATGTMTLASVVGATTSGVTRYRLEDNPSKWGRRVTDPTSSQWLDQTLILTGAAAHTASGVWYFDTEIVMERLRIKRVTTNATNSLTLRLTRGR